MSFIREVKILLLLVPEILPSNIVVILLLNHHMSNVTMEQLMEMFVRLSMEKLVPTVLLLVKQ